MYCFYGYFKLLLTFSNKLDSPYLKLLFYKSLTNIALIKILNELVHICSIISDLFPETLFRALETPSTPLFKNNPRSIIQLQNKESLLQSVESIEAYAIVRSTLKRKKRKKRKKEKEKNRTVRFMVEVSTVKKSWPRKIPSVTLFLSLSLSIFYLSHSPSPPPLFDSFSTTSAPTTSASSGQACAPPELTMGRGSRARGIKCSHTLAQSTRPRAHA